MSDYSASDFLDPEKFRTGHDVCPDRAKQRYLAGVESCKRYADIHIGVNDCVTAGIKGCQGSSRSYEKLGYAAYSAEYLRAILDSGCPVFVHRAGSDGKLVTTQICQGV